MLFAANINVMADHKFKKFVNNAKIFEEDKILNQQAIQINPYSQASFCVEVFFNEISLSTGTCFFIERNQKTFLVTNWHIVSGRNADTKEVLDSATGAIPNKLRVFVPHDNGDGTAQHSDDSYIDVPLYNEDGDPLWYEKCIDGRMIDVALIPMQDINFCHLTIDEAEEPFNEGVCLEITSEIYIIGFPFAKKTGYIPIWKRGSVASEPLIDMEGMPFFYADTATKKGMSGSPVVYYKDRPMIMVNEREKKLSRHWTKFVGVYSGRIGADCDTRNDAQLGRIWKASVVDEIISLYI